MGLVLDATRRVLIIADPNAGLLPGGNIEFLAVPPRSREAAPSTKISQFDLDQQQMVMTKAKKVTKSPSNAKGKKRARK